MAWDDTEEWKYHHTNLNGVRVDKDEYDRRGDSHFLGGVRINNNSTNGNSANENVEGQMGVLVWVIGLGVAGFIVYKVIQFIAENWITIVTILGTCIVCAIACIIIQKKAQKPGLKTFFAIVTSIGLMCAVLFFVPTKKDRASTNLEQNNLEASVLETPTVYQEKLTIMYGKVTSNTLNIRAKPTSSSEVIGRFVKGDRIEITGRSGSWWEVKLENSDGYVDSDFVSTEKIE
ncbi:MAG: SH3 domain-containing protein [Treponema sp.]|jgi:hypothetical protein|nr:SH3 domain-containing protein [Treponema sp.]